MPMLRKLSVLSGLRVRVGDKNWDADSSWHDKKK